MLRIRDSESRATRTHVDTQLHFYRTLNNGIPSVAANMQHADCWLLFRVHNFIASAICIRFLGLSYCMMRSRERMHRASSVVLYESDGANSLIASTECLIVLLPACVVWHTYDVLFWFRFKKRMSAQKQWTHRDAWKPNKTWIKIMNLLEYQMISHDVSAVLLCMWMFAREKLILHVRSWFCVFHSITRRWRWVAPLTAVVAPLCARVFCIIAAHFTWW